MNKYLLDFELLLWVIVFLFLTVTCSASASLSIPEALQNSKQLLLVLSPKWDSFVCVDDKTSPYYNQLIDSATVTDWKSGTSGEHMLEIVPQYTWGSVINYNKNNVAGDGSCIFMHVWRDAVTGTAGCVAMEQDEIIKILGWLDPAKKPVVALFPWDAYKDIQSKWGLPLV